VLPPAPTLTAADARRWAAAAVPLWLTRWVLPAGWLAAAAAAIAGDTAACSAQDPSICGPDVGFAWASVLLFATPILLWWLPLAGCAAGVGFTVADLIWDDVGSGRVAFGLHGLACVAAAVWILRSNVVQSRIAGQATAGFRTRVPDPPDPAEPARALTPDPPDRSDRSDRPALVGNPLRWIAAAALVLAGAGLLGWYVHADRVEGSHVAASRQVSAVVTAVDEVDSTITARPESTAPLTIPVFDTAGYPIGSTVPLRVDPCDADWVRLVAEPGDSTGWLAGGLGALALALVLAAVDLRERRGVRALLRGEHPALTVQVVPDDAGGTRILPRTNGKVPRPELLPAVARVPVAWAPGSGPAGGDDDGDDDWDDEEEWDEQTQAEFGRAWRGEETDTPADGEGMLEDAVLVGTLRDGGWAALVTADGVLLPTGPLRVRDIAPDGAPSAVRRALTRLPLGSAIVRATTGDPAGGDSPHGFPGRPVRVSPAHEPLQLPLTADRGVARRRLGQLLVAIATVAAPAAILWLAEGWWDRGLAVVLGGQLLATAVAMSHEQVTLAPDHLEVVGATARWVVPWARLHGVRREGGRLALAWEPDNAAEVGPFAPCELGPSELGPREQAAERLGAAMLDLRTRALAAPVMASPARRHPGPLWVFLLVYAVPVAGALWWVLRG
jgi:hypothetical protein